MAPNWLTPVHLRHRGAPNRPCPWMLNYSNYSKNLCEYKDGCCQNKSPRFLFENNVFILNSRLQCSHSEFLLHETITCINSGLFQSFQLHQLPSNSSAYSQKRCKFKIGKTYSFHKHKQRQGLKNEAMIIARSIKIIIAAAATCKPVHVIGHVPKGSVRLSGFSLA